MADLLSLLAFYRKNDSVAIPRNSFPVVSKTLRLTIRCCVTT